MLGSPLPNQEDIITLATALATAMATAGISYLELQITDEEFTYEDGENYTPAQLDAYATMILRQDVKQGNPLKGENPILFKEHLDTRYRREIYNIRGIPDPSIQQGIYWRTHPQGRKVNTEEARKKSGAAWYR